ncbi:AI-2E family transporter [Planktothrix sp. FACHB-1365]|uniref:AI-2E family transporter n=1 Tax=Planktothrix sp. FACHB-1365 TaxID=2692855 RepID=UPI0016867174|nr:AI-2E family transporter [Planktothrix sp. FACHB-1365]MBD2483623.1 AI-2E family transporter [Planktothrix sp. FACHB-1365]
MTLGQWFGFSAILCAIYILWQVRQALLLVFAAIVLATALNKLARWIQRFGIKRSWAVFFSISLLILGFITIFLLVVPPLFDQLQELATRVPRGLERGLQRLNLWINYLKTQLPGDFWQNLFQVNLQINALIQQVQRIGNPLIGGVGAFVGNTLGGLLGFLLILVLTIMLLADPMAYRRAFIQLIPSFYRQRMNGILDQCEIALGLWVVGALIDMSVVAVCSLAGLLVLQVPLAFANAILAGLLNLIPNIGPTLSVIPPMAIALLEDPWKAGFVFILYFLIQQAESNFLMPYLMAQQVSLLPAITLLSQGFFLTFFGFLGLLLALPLTVVGQVLVQEILIRDILDHWKQ